MPVIPLPTNAIAQVTWFGTLHDQRVMNTFHYQFIDVPSPTTDYRTYYEAFANELQAAGGFQEKYLDILPTNMLVNHFQIQTVWPIRQRYYFRGVLENGTGAGGDNNTPNVAFSIRRVSETIGPRGVGRIQVPIAENWINNGLVAGAAYAAVAAFTTYMEESYTTVAPDAEWASVLFGVVNDVANVSQIIEAELEDTVRVMRRRTVRIGE